MAINHVEAAFDRSVIGRVCADVRILDLAVECAGSGRFVLGRRRLNGKPVLRVGLYAVLDGDRVDVEQGRARTGCARLAGK
jgi:hypothetical protein